MSRDGRVVSLVVNGLPYEVRVPERLLLSDLLRDELGLTGTHVGCEHGVCGACNVLLDDALVRSCLTLAVQADGRSVTTVEGVAAGDGLHPAQQAVFDANGLQCGYCTPGVVMTLYDLHRRGVVPTEAGLREELAGNLCRCTGYEGILTAGRVLLGVTGPSGPEGERT